MNKINSLRKQIDSLDQKLINLLSKRMKVARNIGKIKKDKKISIVDKKRWKEILESNLEIGKNKGLPKEFIKSIFQLIHKYSIKLQKEV